MFDGKTTKTESELWAEIERLQAAKRRALAIADERSKENVELRAALAPFAECAAPFGPDWSDADEIACEPFEDGGGNGHLLFAFKVGQFRQARKALNAEQAATEKET